MVPFDFAHGGQILSPRPIQSCWMNDYLRASLLARDERYRGYPKRRPCERSGRIPWSAPFSAKK